MSKKFIEQILADFAKDKNKKKKWRDQIRYFYGGNYPHVYGIRQEHLIDTFKYNAIASLYNKIKEGDAQEAAAGDPIKIIQEVSENAVYEIYPSPEGFIRWFKTKRPRTPKEDIFINPENSNEVTIVRSNIDIGLKRIILQAGNDFLLKDSRIKSLMKEAKKAGQGSGTDEDFSKKFFRKGQVLHEGTTTTGSYQLVTFYNEALSGALEKVMGKKGAGKVIQAIEGDDLFSNILMAWSKNSKGKKFEMNDNVHVDLTIGPAFLNPTGSEGKFDWGKKPGLLKRLQKVIMDVAKDDPNLKKLATEEGSRSFVQRAGERAAANIMDNFVKAARKGGAKATKKQSFKEQKGRNYRKNAHNIGTRKKGKNKRVRSIKRATVSSRTIAKRKTSGSNLSIIALLNAKLPRVVMDNMSSPSLENITGRFAQSVKALRTTEKGGMPNIVYTYDRDPYQVFEMSGRGNKRWATQARDPRTIIDKSIREIASKMMMAKFVTMRV